MDKTLTQTESDYLAFLDHTIGETHRMAAKARENKNLAISLLSLCSTAAYKRRELLGIEHPDESICYDEDCHWDGTERLPGEPRREKGDSYADGLDLSALKEGHTP